MLTIKLIHKSPNKIQKEISSQLNYNFKIKLIKISKIINKETILITKIKFEEQDNLWVH